MNLEEWLSGFRDLHDQAKRGTLRAEDVAVYHVAREELAHVLLAAQRVSVLRTQPARRVLRAARALPVDIEFGGRTVRALTHQVSVGGFGALLSPWLRCGESVSSALRLPEGELLRTAARVVEVRDEVGHARVSFEFTGLSDADVERLETFVFDAVLDQYNAV